MIDTIKIKTQVTPQTMKKILSVSTEFRKKNNENDQIQFLFHRADRKTGSYNRTIQVLPDPDTNEVFLEFSIPKQIIGHNIYLLNPDKTNEHLETVHATLEKLFDHFPYPLFWEVYRLDLCYAWHMLDDIATHSTILLLQNLNYPRKKTSKFGTSVMFIGGQHTVKFYMKAEEYLAHDFKELKKLGYKDLAYDLIPISKGILRYEITLRKKAIDKIFNVPKGSPSLIIPQLTETNILKILNDFLQPLLKLKEKNATTKIESAEALLRMYPTRKAARLYAFMVMYYSHDSVDRKFLEDYDRTTIWRNLKDLEQAGVGIPCEIRGATKLTIPSPRQVKSI